MQKITPFLWFNTQAEEAARFYVSVLKSNSKILKVLRYGDAGPGPKGTAMTVEFTLKGQKFVALNGGPHYTFTPAVSFVIDCANQKEVDTYWAKLSEGGQTQPCGWLQDRYGVSWQIVPTIVSKLLGHPNPEVSRRVMQAMLKMSKIDIQTLKDAHAAALPPSKKKPTKKR